MNKESLDASIKTDPKALHKWVSKLTMSHVNASNLRKEDFEQFVRSFFQRANDKYLSRVSEEKEIDLIAHLAQFASQRKLNEIKVRLVNLPSENNGSGEALIALETCMADQRFIIDTIKLTISELGLIASGASHITIPFERNSSGKVLTLATKEDETHQLESVTRFLLSGLNTEEEKEKFLKAIQRNLTSVAASVKDFQKIRKSLHDVFNSYEILVQSGSAKGPNPIDLKEANELIEWLLDNNFVFVSLLNLSADGENLTMNKEKTLGMVFEHLKADGPIMRQANEFFKSSPNNNHVFYLQKSQIKSTTKDAGIMDALLLRRFGKDGNPDGGLVLIGMFTHRALTVQRSSIPFLKNRFQKIITQEQIRPGSSSYSSRVKVFNTLMIEYLFECDDVDLKTIIDSRLDQGALNDATVHIDTMPTKHNAYALLSIPQDAYSDYLLDNIRDLLMDKLGAKYVQIESEASKGQIVPLAFYFAGCTKLDNADTDELEKEVIGLCTTWNTRFRNALVDSKNGAVAHYYSKYAEAFPLPYQQSESIDEIAGDILHIEELLKTKQIQFDFLPGLKNPNKESRLRLYRSDTGSLLLSEILPILHNIGFRVVDEIPTTVTLPNKSKIHIDTFRLLLDDTAGEENYVANNNRLVKGLQAIFEGKVQSDPMNRLMLRPGLSWEDVDILRSYMRYSVQIGPFFDPSLVDRILTKQAPLTNKLIAYFHARFDPAIDDKKSESRSALMEKSRNAFMEGMDKIKDATEDRIFRVFFNLMESTLRTNAFRTDRLFYYISFKFDCVLLDSCPEPRPLYEIYVHHAEMEGCHLRSGKVARGGLRWSDRLDDYRTEIFGLMRAQKSKNVLIVPQGAKGGFVVKGNPKAGQDRKAYGDEMYKVLIRGMLDITDNQLGGKEIRPKNVVCHDAFDPYLVVAADKGTAHLSDTANGLSGEYGFWLGDAFASGGSAGYDHKVEGITAKGAWVCIRHHFGMLGIDPEKDVISVVGIGDMSGDVFGNGMLRSRTIKLVGAFNHAHIFLDPEPDCDASFLERERMFNLPRSGWNDYNVKIISTGGGVYSRAEKSIPLSPEVQVLLGTTETQLSSDELIQKLLTLNVDLLYNGGLGTYIKSSKEDHREVGDKSNDLVRVNGNMIMAKVVGEGGNLGVTQKGRIEYALNGGLINTDAIDNSGGVDCSDREVNLKILFGPLINDGKMSIEDRNKVLKTATPEVLENILEDNQGHALCLSLDEIRSKKNPYLFLWTTEFLGEKGIMVPEREDLPNLKDLQQRGLKTGFTRPELSKLMAFFKMYTKEQLLPVDVARFPLKEEFLEDYFPKGIYKAYRNNINSHMLLRELLATRWIGQIINNAGASLFTDLITDSERSVYDVAIAYTATERWMGANVLRNNILTCMHSSLSSRLKAIVVLEDRIKVAASWVLHFFAGEKLHEMVGSGQDFSTAATKFRDAFDETHRFFKTDKRTTTAHRLEGEIKRLEELGFPKDLSKEMACSNHWPKVFPIAFLAKSTGKSEKEAAEAYLLCGQATGMQDVLAKISTQTSVDLWEAQALKSLFASLRRTNLLLTQKALEIGIAETLKREPTLSQIGREVSSLHANPSDPVPIPMLVVMAEKLHKSVSRL